MFVLSVSFVRLVSHISLLIPRDFIKKQNKNKCACLRASMFLASSWSRASCRKTSSSWTPTWPCTATLPKTAPTWRWGEFTHTGTHMSHVIKKFGYSNHFHYLWHRLSGASRATDLLCHKETKQTGTYAPQLKSFCEHGSAFNTWCKSPK